MESKIKNNQVYFKIHTPNLLKEIANNNGASILKIPLNVFRVYLGKIAQRCIEINDPILNQFMCEMALYEEADQGSKNYNPKTVKKVQINYNKYLKIKNKDQSTKT